MNWHEGQLLASNRGKIGRCQYKEADGGGGELVLTDTGEAMDKKERKDFYIETMEDEFVAVKTMKSISMGLAISMCVVVIYITFGLVTQFICK